MNSNYDFSIIRALRRRLNMTMEDLAKHSGLTYPTVASTETNKVVPSLKTLDAIAAVLQISTSNLLSLAERRIVQKRKAGKVIDQQAYGDEGLEYALVAAYDKAKVVRIRANAGDRVHAMSQHADVHEFCYCLHGIVELRVADQVHRLTPDETVLFDGVLDHEYVQIEDGEYVTVHIPKDAHLIEALLDSRKFAKSTIKKVG